MLTRESERLAALEYFLDRHGYVLDNALTTHSEHMREAAELCAKADRPAMVRAFEESAERSLTARAALRKFTEGDDIG